MSDRTALELAALEVSYPGGGPVLQGLDLRVGDGEKVGVIGPNGSGKTTLFLTGCGVLRPDGGTVRVFDEPVVPGRFNPAVGLVFQNPDDQLFCPSVRDDVAFGPQNLGLDRTEVRARVDAALALTGVAELADRAPHRLSGGQKRMVAIAGVLALHPELVIYDEPSANLDLRARRRLVEFLSASSGTLLVSSHDLELVREVCGRVVLLAGGRVVADGPTDVVLADERVMLAHDLEPPASLRPPGGR